MKLSFYISLLGHMVGYISQNRLALIGSKGIVFLLAGFEGDSVLFANAAEHSGARKEGFGGVSVTAFPKILLR